MTHEHGAMAMERLLRLMAERKASDLFLAPGSPIRLKIGDTMVNAGSQSPGPAAIEALLREIVSETDWAQFERTRELNTSHAVDGVGNFRVNVFRQRGTTASVIRFIPHRIPDFDELHLPASLGELVLRKHGLLLVVGATGSGKSTTLAAMIDHRNERLSGHILTLEEPIEFAFRNKRSIVNQRQIGTDTDSLGIALKNAMRQAPDCILIGEIRDVDTMSDALAYAHSGHLVLATLHANTAQQALTRIVSFYRPDNRSVLLSDLATTLVAIVSQRLVPATAGGRLPVLEILLNTRHIAEMIEQGRLTEIREAMEQSLAADSCTLDHALVQLVRAQQISRADALAHADSPTNLMWLLENETVLRRSGESSAPDSPGGAPESGSAAQWTDPVAHGDMSA